LLSSLRDRFQLLGSPRPGSVGYICTARDVITGQICVIKYAASNTDGAEALVREGALLEDLKHPFMVEVIARFEQAQGLLTDRRVTGFATQWIDADPIHIALRDTPISERVRGFTKLAQVVDYMHRRRILHLDLKPQNVLASKTALWLLDLGTAVPADGAAGEAGGTLGYAAPEVLAGEAASEASDLYSLGTILYEILSGQPPHQEDSPARLRSAVMRGHFVPIRAVAPDVPRKLALATERLLSVQPAQRPESVREMAQDIGHADAEMRGWRSGSPPFMDRDRELHELKRALVKTRQPLAIIGEPGSGRTALVQRALSAGVESMSIIDLSTSPDPARCLLRLLVRSDDPAAEPAALEGAIRAALRTASVSPHWIFVGRREEMHPASRRVLEAVQLPLATKDIRILWAARRCPAETQVFPIPPLPDATLGKLVDFVGDRRDASQQQFIKAARGLPGPLLRSLSGDQSAPNLLPALRRSFKSLCTLPSGIPRVILEAIPNALDTALELESLGRARFGAQGQLFLDDTRVGTITKSIQRHLVTVIQTSRTEIPPLWLAVYAKRIKDREQASVLLPKVIGSTTAPTAEYVEICEWLSESGHVDALNELLRVRRKQGDNISAMNVLSLAEKVGRVDQVDQALRARTIKAAKGLEAGQAACEETLKRTPDDAYVMIQLGYCLVGLGELDRAAEIAHRAEETDRDCAPVALGLRVFLAARQLEQGVQPPDLEPLLARVGELASHPDMTVKSLIHAGTISGRHGWLNLSRSLFLRAGALADRQGDLRQSGISRLSLGNIWLRSGEGHRARAAYTEALQVGRALSLAPLQIRAAYSLVELELRSRRLPAAERMLREFQEAAKGSDDPQLASRSAALEAEYHRLRGDPAAAVATIEAIASKQTKMDLKGLLSLIHAECLFDLGYASEVFDVLGPDKDLHSADGVRRAQVLRGRAYMALARAEFGKALRDLPDNPDLLQRQLTGATLLAAAGEDLNPKSFTRRRLQLQRAAALLTGEDASRAATLRDRLLAGPGARLSGIAGVIEAIHDPPSFPAALARLVAEALGANRVLIMLRIPGLGRQITFQELTGEEAAGISEEVLRRIRKPEDVWQAADAFADPSIRRVSATVRTFKIRSVLAVAIPFEGEAIGALYVDDVLRADAFSRDDVEVLKRLAVTTARVIPLMRSEQRRALPEPKAILGVLHTDPTYINDLTTAIQRLKSHPITNILVTGATGTGKTWLARRLATEVLGKSGIIEAVMRQSEPDKLIGLLGGTRRGDYTGAIAQPGLIKQAVAENKALFLDEVQALTAGAQGALLPLLELPKRRFSGLISSTGLIQSPLTVILGTNAEVSQGRWREYFREDFWFRMTQIHMHLPTLNERGEEVIHRHLMAYLKENGVDAPDRILEPSAIRALRRWPWSGNLRELRVAAEKLAFHHDQVQRSIQEDDLETWRILVTDTPPKTRKRKIPPKEMDSFTQEVLVLLAENGWNQSVVARALGTTPSRVNRALKRIGMLEEVRLQRARETPTTN